MFLVLQAQPWLGPPTERETLNKAPIEFCPTPVFLVFLHMFFSPAWFCIIIKKPCSMALHVPFILQKNLVMALLNELAEHRIGNRNLPGVELPTHRWHRFRHWGECVFFSIWKTSTVKKSYLATELPQACSVRLRKGAGQYSRGVFSPQN